MAKSQLQLKTQNDPHAPSGWVMLAWFVFTMSLLVFMGMFLNLEQIVNLRQLHLFLDMSLAWLIPLFFILWSQFRVTSFEQESIPIQGVITQRWTWKSSTEQGESTSHYLAYTFPGGEETKVEVAGGDSYDQMQIGDAVVIHFLPSEPHRSLLMRRMTVNNTGFPFNKIILQTNENILFKAQKPSVRLDHTLAVLISDRALYLWLSSRNKATWRSFPLSDLQRATLRPGKQKPFGESLLLVGVLILLILAHLIHLLLVLVVLVGSVLIAVMNRVRPDLIKAVISQVGITKVCMLKDKRGTVDLYLQLSNGHFLWQTPDYGYQAEREFDRNILTETLHKLAELGIKTADDTSTVAPIAHGYE